MWSSSYNIICYMKKKHLAAALGILFLLLLPATGYFPDPEIRQLSQYVWWPFNSSYYEPIIPMGSAFLIYESIQLTPDSTNADFSLANKSGRALFNQSFDLWTDSAVASFSSSFLFNVFRINGSIPGEGLAFLIAPALTIPKDSYGQYLGLVNAENQGLDSNQILAIELDTCKQDFDPDDNHIGLNINSVRSTKTVSLTDLGINIAPPNGSVFYMVWIEYDGGSNNMAVYMAEQTPADPLTGEFNIRPRPPDPQTRL